MKSFKILQRITDRQDTSLAIFFKEVARLPMMNPNEEGEIARKAKNGDKKCIDLLITSNLRFVISVAKQYQGKGIPLVDLIQDGILGLIESVDKFDPDKGFRFISYAVWWIRQSIIKSISEQCRTIKLPMSQIITLNKINKLNEKYEQSAGRISSYEELENEADIDFSKANLAITSNLRTMSLDTPFNDEDVSSLIDVVPNNDSENPDSELVNNNISEKITEVLNKLSYREQDVIKMSFGIGMFPMQNEEIANRFGITSERVRQIIKEALEKIRLEYSDSLKELL